MFNKNNNPDYYNDAVKDARVNHGSIEHQTNAKGKLLLIFNLLLISIILGYFIYQNIKPKPDKAVMGVNYTVDIREENKNVEKLTTAPKQDNESYIKALSNELSRKAQETQEKEKKEENKALEDILSNIDTEGFKETTNSIQIDKKSKKDTDLDINELADVINSLVSEELSDTPSNNKELSKGMPVN